MNRQPDYATGKIVDFDKPEETVRQEYEQVLIHSYGYPKENLDIEVQIPRGAGYFPDAADIVIYSADVDRDPTCDIEGIVELKRPDRDDGIQQLKSYMTATSAKWGVWTNGSDISYVCRDPNDPTRILEQYLRNIPAHGQSVADVGKLSKADLRPFSPTELRVTFRRILDKLYANSQIARRDQLGAEMVKLLFAKLEDETSFSDRPPDFRVQAGEAADDVAERISRLFDRAKEALKQDGVFHETDHISLDAESVAEVVGQLERGSLTDTDTDVVGDAFEVFAESRLAGEKGQFFTPRGVVKLAVQLTDPTPDDTVFDPACGSGGFLIHAMKHIWEHMDADPSARWGRDDQLAAHKKRIAKQKIFGVDKELDLVKIAKAYMSIAGDGLSHIRRGDSLQEGITSKDQFDVVLANPPFGTKSKVQESLSRHYDLGHKWSNKSGKWVKQAATTARDPYLLFIERCIDLTKDGGRLAIVLPETVFHAPSLSYVRNFLRSKGSIWAVIDLPHNSFRPYCNAKTCLLVMTVGMAQSDVIMAKPKEMGHDLQGKTLFRPGTNDIWDDLPVVAQELASAGDASNRFTFVVPRATFESDDCWVPQYNRGVMNPPTMPSGCYGVMLEDLVDDGTMVALDGHGSPKAALKGRGDIPYIRVNDVVNWELYHNPIARVPASEWKRLKADVKPPEIDDVIMVRRGSYRIGTVAIAGPRDTKTIFTKELLTFRVEPGNARGISPEYLLAMLSTPTVQEQIPSRVCVDTTLPNLGNRWRTLVLPVHKDAKQRKSVSDGAAYIIALRREAWKDTCKLALNLGDLTT